MASWPVNSIGNPTWGMGHTPYTPQIKHDFEANYQQTRRQFSRTRYKYDLSYTMMTNSAYACLETFVNSTMGQMFGIAHPVTTIVRTCTFASQLEGTPTSYGFWSAKISIEEV